MRLCGGTQEVSGGDLLRQFAGKRGHGGGVACDVDAWDGEKDEEGGDALGNKGGSVKRHRASPPSSISRSSHPARSDVDMDDTCDDVDDGSSTNEALKLVHDDSSDSDGGRGAIGRVGAPRRRRRVQKPKSATRALEEGGDSGGRKEAKGNMDASTSFSVSNINHRGGAKTSEQYRGIKVKTSGSRGNGSRRIQEVVLNFVLGHGCLGDLSRIDVVDTIESIPSHAITMCYLFMCHVSSLHVSCVMCHVSSLHVSCVISSCVMCHLVMCHVSCVISSCVMCHVSCVISSCSSSCHFRHSARLVPCVARR